MTINALLYTDSSYLPPGFRNQPAPPTRLKPQTDPKPPRKPDWLLIIMGILFLLTLLVAWLADIPALLR